MKYTSSIPNTFIESPQIEISRQQGNEKKKNTHLSFDLTDSEI